MSTAKPDPRPTPAVVLLDPPFWDAYDPKFPDSDGEPMAEKPSWDIHANYVKRSLHALPKSGTKRPWNVRQNYLADAIDYRFDRIEESMVFGRVADRAALAG